LLSVVATTSEKAQSAISIEGLYTPRASLAKSR
jgi:hypothetical protein